MATYADTLEPSRGHSSKLHILYIFHRIIQMRLLYAGIMQSENTVTNIHIDRQHHVEDVTKNKMWLQHLLKPT